MYRDNIFPEIPSLMPMEVETANPARLSVWDQRDARELGILWDSTLLTRNTNARVDINLVGYMETRETVNNSN